jgi:biopolymer transport protein ExbD
MVVTPLKPSRFRALIPEPPEELPQTPPKPDPMTLVVRIRGDGALELSQTGDMGSVNDTRKLSRKLVELFQRRLEAHAYRVDMIGRIDLPVEKRIQRTVFIKAPENITYGEVARVIDGIKGAGAEPVALQIDELD